MRHLFEIRHDIEKRYKDGDDWVYAKGKKAEIDLIKELYEKCGKLEDDNRELRDELRVLDRWDAYKRAYYELEHVRNAYKQVNDYIESYDDAKAAWEQAREVLRQSEEYLEEIKEKIVKGEEDKL
jgi:DNA repair exonuclease SbcCD ATPase subunit